MDFIHLDEFVLAKQQLECLSNFTEYPPYFPPSFKYKQGSLDYNTTKGCPSWTDRVFFCFGKTLNFDINYGQFEETISDHRPVYLQLHFLEKEENFI